VWVTCADLLTLALVALAIFAFAGGGFRKVMFGVRVSLTSGWRVLVVAGVVLVIRYLVRFKPHLLRRILQVAAVIEQHLDT